MFAPLCDTPGGPPCNQRPIGWPTPKSSTPPIGWPTPDPSPPFIYVPERDTRYTDVFGNPKYKNDLSDFSQKIDEADNQMNELQFLVDFLKRRSN